MQIYNDKTILQRRNLIYTEREVNIILADFNDDFCTLRRDLIGEGLMARSMQTYWRLDPSDNRDSK